MNLPKYHDDGTPKTQEELEQQANEFAQKMSDDYAAMNCPKVRLETQGGGFVGNTHHLPFNIDPHVMVWGMRIFRQTDRMHKDRRVYEEAFAVAVLAVTHEED